MSEALAAVRQDLLQLLHAETLIWPRHQHPVVLCGDKTEASALLRL